MSEVTCPVCKNVIGRTHYIDGVAFLDCGGVIVRDMKANCKQCGRAIFWCVPDVRLERLIKRMLKNRETYATDDNC